MSIGKQLCQNSCNNPLSLLSDVCCLTLYSPWNWRNVRRQALPLRSTAYSLPFGVFRLSVFLLCMYFVLSETSIPLKAWRSSVFIWGPIRQSFLMATIWQQFACKSCMKLVGSECFEFCELSLVTIAVGLSWFIMANVHEASDCSKPSLCSGWSLLYPVTGYDLGRRSFSCKDKTQEYLFTTSQFDVFSR